MRDVVAAIVALVLLFVAASLATALRLYRRRRQRARESERARGRTIVAELPTADELVLFSEDPDRFYYGERAIDKDQISAVRVLINGAPLATVSRRPLAEPDQRTGELAAMDDRPEGIARDRWDVAIDTTAGVVLVECGAIRERVSQELARAVFDSVKHAVERRSAPP